MTRTRRPVVTPQFGAELRRLRGAQSRGAVVSALTVWGVTITRQTLQQYEEGRILAPDPLALWALGRHYGLEQIDDLLSVLASDRTKRAPRTRPITITRFSLAQRDAAEAFGRLGPGEQKLLLKILRALETP
jgi:hypothetical protein